MKTYLLFLGLLSFTSIRLNAQTLFIPSGNTGIGASLNANVGIGISSPLAKLDIRGNIYMPYGNKILLGNVNTSGNRLQLGSTTQHAYIDFYQNLIFRSGSASNDNKFIFTSDGKFGIGTSDPKDNFQIGQSISKLNLGQSYGQAIGWGSSYIGFNAARNNGIWYLDSDGSANGGCVIYGDVGGGINFAPLVSTSGLSRTLTDNQVREAVAFKVKSDGLVIAKDFEVTLTGWPDFVFCESYQLLTFSELESYIKNNRHLPGLPSASDVENSSIRLGETNKLLLLKIEELTLYVIKLSKENKELALKIEKIEQKYENK
jgi:hypothetical protein